MIRSAHLAPHHRAILSIEHLEAREVPATFTWSQVEPGAYDWNNAANWGGAGVPNAPGDIVNINSALTGNQVIQLNKSITVGVINLGSTGAIAGFSIAANGGSLTLDNATDPALINVNGKAGDALNTPITLKNNVTISASTSLAIGGPITATAGTISTAGTGTIALTNNLAVGTGVTINGTGVVSTPETFVVASFFDSAIYEFDSSSGTFLSTLVAPNSSQLVSGPAGSAFFRRCRCSRSFRRLR